jgi:hypothetical protein
MFAKFFLMLILAGLAPGSSSTMVSAEGTLLFDNQRFTLINTGSAPLDIEQLLFVSGEARRPVRFEAQSWNVPALQPGECVQVMTANASAFLPDTCRRLVRWLLTTRSDVYFWQASATQDQFRVVAGTTDLITCAIAAGRCVFSLDKVPPVESLILMYDAQTLQVINEAPTIAPLSGLTFCDSRSGYLCGMTLQTPSQLEPGACAALTTTVNVSTTPCPVTQGIARAFWLRPFKVISPVTAHTTLCPAALPGTSRVCVIAR